MVTIRPGRPPPTTPFHRAGKAGAALLMLMALVAACDSGRSALARRYLSIAAPANARLDGAVDRFRDHQGRDLAVRAATATSLAELASYAPARAASDALAEQDVSTIRRVLGLPPPDLS